MSALLIALLLFPLASEINSANVSDLETDIVIVGGGTAGSILASRLCVALPHLKIVVLEKGKVKFPKDDLYRKSIRMQFDATRTDLVDKVKTEPTVAFNNRTDNVLVGTGFGGATNVNGGYVTSASNKQYLKAFSHMTIEEIRKAKKMYRNQTRASSLGPDGQEMGPVLMKAVKDTGVDLVINPPPETLPEDDRIYQETIFTQTGFRQSVDETYINPVLDQCKNLRLVNNVLVDRLEFKNTSTGIYQATGVHFIYNGTTKHFMKVNQEVILSAGGVYSPAILHRSGIGEKKDLMELGIKQLIDLEVGNFSNKIITMVFGEYKRPAGSRVNDPAYILSEESKARFWAGKGGPLSTGVAGGGGQVLFSGATCLFSITAETHLTGRKPLKPTDKGMLFSVCMCPSDSKGKVQARSTDPKTPPKINLNFVNSDYDVDKIRQCAKLLISIIHKLPPELEANRTFPLGGIESFEWKNSTGSSYHLSGAAAVGRVLDKNYHVKGTQGLRVVDSSSVPPGYAYGLFPATLLNAEHASSLIIDKHIRRRSK